MRLNAKWTIRSQYFIYFGVLGIFLPYFNLYCYHLSFSGLQIGIISAVRSITLALFPVVWGIFADRFHLRRPIYISCNVISTAVWALLLLTDQYIAILCITIAYGIFSSPLISFLEAFTMDILGAGGEKQSYGRIRAWGSISFIVIVIGMGLIIDSFTISIIIPSILIGSMIQSMVSINIPKIQKPSSKVEKPKLAILFKKPVGLFLMTACLMLVSHGTYYGFFSIHLENLGYGKTFIGFAWALASAAEILIMLKSQYIFSRFTLERVLIFSFMVAAMRWLILFTAQSAYIIMLSQLLHAVTYGTFHMASILYTDRLMPKHAKTFGQAANNSVTYGLGLMVGFLFNGQLFDMVSSHTLFLFSSIFALSGGVLFLVFTWRWAPAIQTP